MRDQILLMTRPLAASEQFVARLDPKLMQGVRVIHAPLIEIIGTDVQPTLHRYDGVIFTSTNGVRFAPDGKGMTAYCVGDQTAINAQSRGWNVRLTAQDAVQLVDKMNTAKVDGPVLHLAGVHRRGNIAGRLKETGTMVDLCVLYDQPLIPLSQDAKTALLGEDPVILPLFSPRTAAHLADQVQDADTTAAIGLSQAVADAAQSVHFKEMVIAQAPTGNEMANSIEMLLRQNRLS